MKTVYIIGALKNKNIPVIAQQVRAEGFDVYDDWWAPGEFADLNWQEYCKIRGLSYAEALNGWHARQVFDIDYFHLNRCHAGILVLPAGKSGHLELGYLKGSKKGTYILLDGEPEKYDIMYRFADMVTTDLNRIVRDLHDRYDDPVEWVRSLNDHKV